MKKILGILLILPITLAICSAQSPVKYDLYQLLADHKLSIFSGDTTKLLSEGEYKGVSCSGLAWLTGINFSTGTIDVDLRGRDVYQQSFIGIAFHGSDNKTYEAIYFRPFNFQTPDTLRHLHMVQYISEPDYPWERLRKEHPLVYENTITPGPIPTKWLHAHIVVTKDEITVYVNHSAAPSLKVKKLNDKSSGSIGLWNYAYAGDFANLIITNDH